MDGSTVAAQAGVRPRDLLGLAKSGITSMVALSAAAGMLVAADGWLPPALWIHTLLGTALVSAGASALNQVIERAHDARMRRTAQRPIPSGRLHPDVGLLFGVTIAVAGMLELAFGANLLAALIAGLTLFGYVFVYTPLKRVSSLSTVVGAFPGAAPPLIGWVAVRGTLDPEAWALFGLLFFWQMPHFLAIAWLYREDYGRAGLQMLPVVEPDGASTSRQSLLYAAALVPVSILPSALGLAGLAYAASALALGLVFLGVGVKFAMSRTKQNARLLFTMSLIYLPALWIVMMIDRSH